MFLQLHDGTIRNGIGYTLNRLQCSLASTKNIGTMAYMPTTYCMSCLATLVANSSSRVKHVNSEFALVINNNVRRN